MCDDTCDLYDSAAYNVELLPVCIIFYFYLKNQTRYGAITHRDIEMVGCQKSKCSSSWPPITTFTCIVNIQTFIPAFAQRHSIPIIQTSISVCRLNRLVAWSSVISVVNQQVELELIDIASQPRTQNA